MPKVRGPLHGVRVVELGRFITAPYAAMLLGDMGAEVIKVEAPQGGDPFRQTGSVEVSARFVAFNRNKQSITIDLRLKEGREALLRLLETSSVLVENFRAGYLDGMGLGYDSIKDRCPGLIYCSITGAGTGGPLSGAPMYDAIGQGLSGLMAQLSGPSGPQPLGPAMSDSVTGMTAAFAVQSALIERFRTGCGQYVQTSMLEATVSFLAEPAAHFFITGEEQDSLTRPRQSQSFGFRGADEGPFVIHLSSPDKFWHQLLEVIDRPDLADDPRFSSYQLRVQNYVHLREELAKEFGLKDRGHWLTALAQHDVPVAPVLGTRETFEHEQVRGLGLEMILEGDQGLRVAGRGARLDSLQQTLPEPSALSADTDEILISLGYSQAEIDDLRRRSVVL